MRIMEDGKKSKQPRQQPWSEEKQIAFRKMALLQRAAEEARKREEVPMTDMDIANWGQDGKVLWKRR